MKTALYARVSTKDKGQDTENQLRVLRQFCLASGHEVVAEFVEKVSATGSKRRPEYERMYNEAYKKKFDLILFWSLDRFSREGVLETLNRLNLLTSYGVGWKSYTEQYLDSTGFFREAVIAILAAIAKQESIRRGERVREGLETARAKGHKLGRKRVTVELGRVRELQAGGRSLPEIAKAVGVSRASLCRILASQKPPSGLAA